MFPWRQEPKNGITSSRFPFRTPVRLTARQVAGKCRADKQERALRIAYSSAKFLRVNSTTKATGHCNAQRELFERSQGDCAMPAFTV